MQAHTETYKCTVQILHSVSSILLFNLDDESVQNAFIKMKANILPM